MSEKGSGKPFKHVRVGNVNVTIWENESKEGDKFYTASIQCSYKDKKTDEWKNSSTFGVADLPKAIAALETTYGILAVKIED